ncbi:MAG: hypothetical protein ACRBBM_08785, partial [Pseudomonadaceae bacterium]
VKAAVLAGANIRCSLSARAIRVRPYLAARRLSQIDQSNDVNQAAKNEGAAMQERLLGSTGYMRKKLHNTWMRILIVFLQTKITANINHC